MAERILTTHAGSLPRPDELADMIWARMDGQDVDEAALEARIDSAVAEVIEKQRSAGIDVVSDGELSKTGFSTYVNERFSGFDGRSEFQADDVADFPQLAMRLFNTPSMAHIVFSNCVGPVELSDKAAVHRDVERLTRALGDIPPEQVRLHVCWGNYAGPHHKDVPLEQIIGEVLKVNAGTIYVEGANPRHAHEWRVFENVRLPDDKSVILGVIDVKSNCVEHPQLVADRLVRLGKIVGKERLIAGTDCGFDTFIRFSQVDPAVAWLKLKSLSEGAELASAEL
jgi:methionine synthase II (cobalamin-independent)